MTPITNTAPKTIKAPVPKDIPPPLICFISFSVNSFKISSLSLFYSLHALIKFFYPSKKIM